MASLITVKGPDLGRQFSLDHTESAIGRNPDAAVWLESLAVSRNHARISCDDGVYYIEDLGSSNGTSVNGHRIEGRTPITERDTLQIGPYEFRLSVVPGDVKPVDIELGDAELRGLLEKLLPGEEGKAARNTLLMHTEDRLLQMTRKLFRKERRLRQLERTDHVLSQLLVRLDVALSKMEPPNVRAFYKLASMHIRWVLKDLAREHPPERQIIYSDQPLESAAKQEGPEELAQWAEFHEMIETLPPDQRELFDLLYYQGLEQAEASTLLGIPLRTLKRRWLEVKQAIALKMHNQMPGNES